MLEPPKINNEMKISVVHAIRELAKEDVLASVLTACSEKSMPFGKGCTILCPIEPRLSNRLSKAVFQAPVDFGVVALPIPTWYGRKL